MRAEDMMRLMELEEPDVKTSEVFTGPEIAAGGVPVVKSDYALKLDKWSQRRGEELVSTSDELKELAGKLGTKAADGYWDRAVSDFHAAAFEPNPELHEVGHCNDELRHDFVKNLSETPDFAAIRTSTVLNTVASEVATTAFAASFAKRLAEAEKEQMKGPKPGKKAPGTAPAVDAEIATMKAAATACVAAKKAVDEYNEASAMAGLGDGANGRPLDPARLAALHKRVKASPRLKNIAELAGRFRRIAQSKQRMKVSHGADEVIGVTLGDEISRLIPSELATLLDDDFGLDAARRLLEKQSFVRDMRAVEPAGRGPIVVTVDESGSMQGNPVETAKALALALAWIAKKQNRWCCLLGFSDGHKIDPSALCILPPGRWDENKLLDWLIHFFGGGTTMDVPLRELPGLWPELVKHGMTRGKTDIVMITDARVDIPEELVKEFLGFKASEKVKLSSILIGSDPGDLPLVSDDVHAVAALDVESDAVGAVLSV